MGQAWGCTSKGAVLVMAAANGDVRLAQELLRRDPRSALYYNYNDKTSPLIQAAARGHFELVQCIVETAVMVEGVDKAKRLCIDHCNAKHQSALMVACKHGHADCVEYLATNGADPLVADDRRHNTCLHFAVLYGHSDCVDKLLGSRTLSTTEQGRSLVVAQLPCTDEDGSEVTFVNCHNGWGLTALHIAVFQGSVNTVRSLLRHGATVDAVITQAKIENSPIRCSVGSNALHVAAVIGNVSMAKAILEAQDSVPGLELRSRLDGAGMRPCDYAARARNPVLVHLLDERLPVSLLRQIWMNYSLEQTMPPRHQTLAAMLQKLKLMFNLELIAVQRNLTASYAAEEEQYAAGAGGTARAAAAPPSHARPALQGGMGVGFGSVGLPGVGLLPPHIASAMVTVAQRNLWLRRQEEVRVLLKSVTHLHGGLQALCNKGEDGAEWPSGTSTSHEAVLDFILSTLITPRTVSAILHAAKKLVCSNVMAAIAAAPSVAGAVPPATPSDMEVQHGITLLTTALKAVDTCLQAVTHLSSPGAFSTAMTTAKQQSAAAGATGAGAAAGGGVPAASVVRPAGVAAASGGAPTAPLSEAEAAAGAAAGAAAAVAGSGGASSPGRSIQPGAGGPGSTTSGGPGPGPVTSAGGAATAGAGQALGASSTPDSSFTAATARGTIGTRVPSITSTATDGATLHADAQQVQGQLGQVAAQQAAATFAQLHAAAQAQPPQQVGCGPIGPMDAALLASLQLSPIPTAPGAAAAAAASTLATGASPGAPPAPPAAPSAAMQQALANAQAVQQYSPLTGAPLTNQFIPIHTMQLPGTGGATSPLLASNWSAQLHSLIAQLQWDIGVQRHRRRRQHAAAAAAHAAAAAAQAGAGAGHGASPSLAHGGQGAAMGMGMFSQGTAAVGTAEMLGAESATTAALRALLSSQQLPTGTLVGHTPPVQLPYGRPRWHRDSNGMIVGSLGVPPPGHAGDTARRAAAQLLYPMASFGAGGAGLRREAGVRASAEVTGVPAAGGQAVPSGTPGRSAPEAAGAGASAPAPAPAAVVSGQAGGPGERSVRAGDGTGLTAGAGGGGGDAAGGCACGSGGMTSVERVAATAASAAAAAAELQGTGLAGTISAPLPGATSGGADSKPGADPALAPALEIAPGASPDPAPGPGPDPGPGAGAGAEQAQLMRTLGELSEDLSGAEEEQASIWSDDDSALCSICMDQNVVVQVAGCQHGLCVQCAFQLTVKGRELPSCPFCRQKIPAFEARPVEGPPPPDYGAARAARAAALAMANAAGQARAVGAALMRGQGLAPAP